MSPHRPVVLAATLLMLTSCTGTTVLTVRNELADAIDADILGLIPPAKLDQGP
jgi:hypothetical protein